jgi:hypothetical protein
MCADQALDFVVNGTDIGGAIANLDDRGPWRNFHLYSCDANRTPAG